MLKVIRLSQITLVLPLSNFLKLLSFLLSASLCLISPKVLLAFKFAYLFWSDQICSKWAWSLLRLVFLLNGNQTKLHVRACTHSYTHTQSFSLLHTHPPTPHTCPTLHTYLHVTKLCRKYLVILLFIEFRITLIKA